MIIRALFAAVFVLIFASAAHAQCPSGITSTNCEPYSTFTNALAPVTSPSSTDRSPLVQGSTTKKIPGQPGTDFRQFGADPTGAGDSSAAFTAAMSSFCSQNGGQLLVPAGTFRVHDVVVPCAGVTIVGISAGGTVGYAPDSAYAGSVFNCQGMTAYCVHLGATTPQRTRMAGMGIRYINFTNEAGGSGITLVVSQGWETSLDHLRFQASPQAIQIYGSEQTHLSFIDLRNPTTIGIESYGDMHGYNSGGSACSGAGDLATCSTRQDLTTFDHVNGYSTAAVGLYIHDLSFGNSGTQFTFEGGTSTVKIRCAAGWPNAGFCPAQTNFENLEGEGATGLNVDLQDTQAFRCHHCFFAGAGQPSAPTNVLSDTLVNYASSGILGELNLDHSFVYNAKNACIYVGVDSVYLTGNTVFDCSLSGSGAYPAVDLHAGTSATAQGNQFCNWLANGVDTAYGMQIDAGYDRVSLANNTFFGCVSGNILDNSAFPGSVYETNSNPPPPSGAITSVTGCGSGCTVAVSTGNEFGGIIGLTAGAGAGSTATFAMALHQPLYPVSNCQFYPQNGATGWAFGASALSTSNSSTTVSVFVSNNGENFAGAYSIGYTCKGF